MKNLDIEECGLYVIICVKIMRSEIKIYRHELAFIWNKYLWNDMKQVIVIFIVYEHGGQLGTEAENYYYTPLYFLNFETCECAGSHHERSHPWQRSCGEDLTGKGGSGLMRFSGSALVSIPKPESVCLTILCLLPTLLTLTGGYPWPFFSGKSQLRALVNKSLGHEKKYFYFNPSVGILACQTGLSILYQLTHMIVHNSPNLKGTGNQNILKVLMNIESFKR